MEKFKVTLIIPVFNEEGCINDLTEVLLKYLECYNDYEIIFIDDGSKDKSLSLIKEIRKNNNKIHYIAFSKNFGHQNAVKAGIDHSTGDCVISMDADFQHPPELIVDLVKKWKEGFDIVYTIRKDNSKISLFKKMTAKIFYRLISSISEINIEQGAADFRLFDKKVVDEFRKLKENNIFLRGMVKWVGFKQISVEYTANNRKWGDSKYTLKKMVSLAFSGITSFSIKPLRISLIVGTFTAIVSLLYGLYALFVKLFTDKTIAGWTSVFIMVVFIGAIQLIMIGILGEYIGKLFMESKKRPNYIINENSLISEQIIKK